MNSLELVKLPPLMEHTSGSREIVVGLIDGPVVMDHPDLAGENIREIPGRWRGACARASSAACLHGTFVAGILCAHRNSTTPGICPGCTLLVRPIFVETQPGMEQLPGATPEELAAAIMDCIDAGARVLNLSCALIHSSTPGEQELVDALDYAARRGVIIAAAAGNQEMLGSTPITRHPWVLPVVAYETRGRPMIQSNLGQSIGRRGLGAPGERITSLSAHGGQVTMGGTSAATPFVTGAVALLWSLFPDATASMVKLAVMQSPASRRLSVVPPLLNAWAAYQTLARTEANAYKENRRTSHGARTNNH